MYSVIPILKQSQLYQKFYWCYIPYLFNIQTEENRQVFIIHRQKENAHKVIWAEREKHNINFLMHSVSTIILRGNEKNTFLTDFIFSIYSGSTVWQWKEGIHQRQCFQNRWSQLVSWGYVFICLLSNELSIVKDFCSHKTECLRLGFCLNKNKLYSCLRTSSFILLKVVYRCTLFFIKKQFSTILKIFPWSRIWFNDPK